MFPILSLLSLLVLSLPSIVLAQNTSLSVFVSEVQRTSTFISNGRQVESTSFSPTTVTSTIVFTPSPSVNSSASATSTAPTASATGPPPIKLDTVLDPGFGVLGAILILTGLPCAFLGHKNRWSSYFLTGFYSLSVVCLALILKFGVLAAINPPNTVLRGLFVLSCGVAGVGGGAICILFWHQAKYFVGALGGFTFGIWVQCFHNGGLIRPIGFRWILYIACSVIGFILCTVPKLHYHILLISTAMVGATAFMLGVDCYTLAGIKEFYVYNLGFVDLFPKFSNIPFPVTQTMQIELGLIAATALAGMAIQFRVLTQLRIKLKQITADQKRRNEELDAKAAERFAAVDRDLERWENEHGRLAQDYPLKRPIGTPGAQSDDTLIGKRTRLQSNLSEFMAPALDAESPTDRRQSIGILPVMELGTGIESNLPSNLVEPTADGSEKEKVIHRTDPAIKEKEGLLTDIEDIRKSIDWLRKQSPTPSVAGIESRRVSTTSRARTLSQDIGTSLNVAETVPARRPRVQSMDILSSMGVSDQMSRGRTTSTPLRDDDWDAYVQERQLFTPPSGVTEAIPTSKRRNSASMLLSMPHSVKDALDFRRRRESALALSDSPALSEEPLNSGDSSSNPRYNEDLAAPWDGTGHQQKKPSGNNVPVQILPPQKKQPDEKQEPRTRTYEELAERHRRKMQDLQNPLSQAEKEQAALTAAKQRWARSKQLERDDVEKRQAEKKAAVKDKAAERHSRQSSEMKNATTSHRASRSLTPDRLTPMPAVGGGKRSSTAKVLEWQRYQDVDADNEQRRAISPTPMHSNRKSPTSPVATGNNPVPFPGRPPRENSSRRA